ncbi:MAG: NlpC/P60 family protein [Actinomycetota bacterium]|nr:NlpC/P60 family protein [Actinomycetota bacterium]
MRRTLWIWLVVCVGGGVASIVPTLTASAQEGPSTVSQGSIADHPYVQVTDGPSPGYSQVVDNDTKGRFDAPGWEERSGVGQFGDSYAYAGAAKDGPARFKVKVPTTGTYSVYARWPASEGNSAAARFGVSTTSGVEWTEEDQREDGDLWVKIGAYEMKAGDGYAVQVAQGAVGSGGVVADAVVVLSGDQANPEEAAGQESNFQVAGGRVTGRDVVHMARRHLGTPYVKSPPHKCKAFRKEDCSCLTKVVFRRFGRSLPDNPRSQWKRGKRVTKPHLRPGDLVFFDENKNGKLQPWDHVGIYSGNGFLVHASSYFGEVTESKMKYIRGYWGAKRMTKLR